MNKGLYSYALFALPLSFIGIPLYIYLPEHYSSNFGISLISIGLIILLTRIFDTITDPICGYISDRLSTFRKTIICLSALMLGVSFYALFNPVINDAMVNLIVFSVITYFFFSLLTINHLALIGNFKDKILTSSTRECFTVTGLLLATIIPSLLMLKYSSIQAFKIVGVGVCFLLLMCSLLFAKNVKMESVKTKSQFKLNDINKPILWKYFSVLLFNGMAIATPSTLILFYIKNFLQLEKYTGLFLATYFLSAIICIPLWQFICNKIGAIKLFKIAMVCSIGVFSLCYFVTNEDFLFYWIICLLSGVFFGIDLIAPTLITNNIIEKHNIESVRSFVFSVTHFISKIAIAVVSGSLLIVLGSKSVVEYNQILHFSYTILPCILKIMALYVLYQLKTL